MAVSLGAIAFPLMVLIPILKDRGPVKLFLLAGATSAETARRPQSLKAKGNLDGALKRGVLIDVGDGRYYVDIDRYKAARNRMIAIFGGLGLLLAAAVLLIWPPW
jgi:hypothetical protein